MEFYCVKCKKKVEQADYETVKTKNNRNMAEGKCPVCATTIVKFVKA